MNKKKVFKRLNAELKKIKNSDNKNEMKGIEIFPTDNVLIWVAKMKGPNKSPYENGTYDILIKFTEEYPFKPPSVKFLDPNRIFHPNIYRDGKICVDILQTKWAPALNVTNVLISLRSLLEDPNISSPANREAAILYSENRSKYNEKVKKCISNNIKDIFKYNMKKLEDLNI
jgi:ubiquitin-protein ligase